MTKTPRGLANWHHELARQFSDLASRRAEGNWPVFALEHGLDNAGVEALKLDVRGSLAGGRLGSLFGEHPTSETYLPWIVYAAEFGYEYSGDEYWPSFAASTKGWQDSNDARRFFRRSFERFANAYRGARPTGGWAAKFNNIAWPVTHGVVAKVLQRHLAKLLYEQRFVVPQYLAQHKISELGKHLRHSSAAYSDRFRVFADNEELLGQIAAALLVEKAGEERLISAATLDRIVADINEERAAGEWLHEARSTANRFRVRGLGTPGMRTSALGFPAISLPDSRSPATPHASHATAPISGVRVQLVPGRTAEWDLRIEVPDLTALVSDYSHIAGVLQGRARLFGSSRPLASGMFLHGGTQPVQVPAWPPAGEPFLYFDSTPGDLRPILNGLFCPTQLDPWLFKIGSDGRATLVKQRFVNPGCSYVLLSRATYERPAPQFRRVAVACTGVTALQFDVPNHLDDLWPVLLERLGLQPSMSLTVWPAGYPAAAWDSAGGAEWLIGEEIILGIATDHPVRALRVELDADAPREMPVSHPGGQPIFLSLGREQSRGRHRVLVQTVPQAPGTERLSGSLEFLVRTPRPLPTGQCRQAALLFVIDPPAPTLEDVWANRVDLQLNGPPGQPVKATICLGARGTDKQQIERASDLHLPIDRGAWRQMIEKIRNDKAVQDAYDAAYLATVTLDAGLLGKVSLRAERAFTPLRWIVRAAGERLTARLVDDTGEDDAEVTYFGCQSPDSGVRLSYADATKGLPAVAPGGLFVAATDDASASIVVSPPLRVLRGLEALGLTVVPKTVGLAPGELAALLKCIRRWEEARVTGSALSSINRERVLTRLMAHFAGAVAGESWRRLEADALADPERALSMMRHYLVQSTPSLLPPALLRPAEAFGSVEVLERVNGLTDLMLDLLPDLSPTIALRVTSRLSAADESPQARRDRARMLFEFALRAATSPSATITYAGPHLKAGIRLLLDHPEVLRIARFCALSVHDARASGVVTRAGVYSGWEWTCAS